MLKSKKKSQLTAYWDKVLVGQGGINIYDR